VEVHRIESAVKSFITCHIPSWDRVDITQGLAAVTAHVIQQGNSVAQIARELADEKDRVAFMKAEIDVLRDMQVSAPSPIASSGGRRTLPHAASSLAGQRSPSPTAPKRSSRTSSAWDTPLTQRYTH
jgi:hypothetical protein